MFAPFYVMEILDFSTYIMCCANRFIACLYVRQPFLQGSRVRVRMYKRKGGDVQYTIGINNNNKTLL